MAGPCVNCGMSLDVGGNLTLGVIEEQWPFNGNIDDLTYGGRLRCDPGPTARENDLWGFPRGSGEVYRVNLPDFTRSTTFPAFVNGVPVLLATSLTLTITNPNPNFSMEFFAVYSPGLFRYDGARGDLFDYVIQSNINGAGFTTNGQNRLLMDLRNIPAGPLITTGMSPSLNFERFTLTPNSTVGDTRTVQLRAEVTPFFSANGPGQIEGSNAFYQAIGVAA